MKSSHFRHQQKQKLNADPRNEIKSVLTTHTTTKSIPSLHWNQAKFHSPHWNQVGFCHPHKSQENFDAHTRTKWFPARINKQLNFDHPRKTKSIDHHTKSKPFLVRTPRPSNYRSIPQNQVISARTGKWSQFWRRHENNQFRALRENQVKFDTVHKKEGNVDPIAKNKSIRSPLKYRLDFDASTQKLTTTPTLKQGNFDQHIKSKSVQINTLKSSQFRPPTQEPHQFHPYTEMKSRVITYNEIMSISTTLTNTNSKSMLTPEEVISGSHIKSTWPPAQKLNLH